MPAAKKDKEAEEKLVLINFKTTAAHRKDLRRLALELDMTLTDLILAALKEYKERHLPKD